LVPSRSQPPALQQVLSSRIHSATSLSCIVQHQPAITPFQQSVPSPPRSFPNVFSSGSHPDRRDKPTPPLLSEADISTIYNSLPQRTVVLCRLGPTRVKPVQLPALPHQRHPSAQPAASRTADFSQLRSYCLSDGGSTETAMGPETATLPPGGARTPSDANPARDQCARTLLLHRLTAPAARRPPGPPVKRAAEMLARRYRS
jgi:hypothetical protein